MTAAWDGISIDEWLEQALSQGQLEEVISVVRVWPEVKWQRFVPILEAWVALSLSAGQDREVIRFVAEMPEHRKKPFREIWKQIRGAA